ncbi:protein nrt1/ ptr family 1.2 [Quercus suber]|uniref:Protein nrt1/ ptr family 1.2 n=1 Tax=Quercus suber TaxID=58331 RepID=A0AAW0LG40_QUESU
MENPSDEKDMVEEPLLDTYKTKGGFKTLPFIIANEAFEGVASFGLMPNMILYLTREFGMQIASAANVLFLWSAATNFMPILGAYLADSYVGRYRMIGFGSIVSLMGMVLLWLTTLNSQAKISCSQSSSSCNFSTAFKLLHLYSSFGLMAIGAGGLRSSSLAFGADQLDKRDNIRNAAMLESFFSWYYVSKTASALIAVTFIVYVQDKMGWMVGFGIPALLMSLSVLSFFLASPFYVKLKSDSSLLTGFTQVLVASYKNRRMRLSSQATPEIYHRINGSMLLLPSEKLRSDFTLIFDKHTAKATSPVNQVEELKALIRVIPLWSAGIMMSVTLSQNSFPVLQAASMDRHITPYFEIPAGSFSVFLVITITLWITLYDRVVLPLASKVSGKPCRLNEKKRMGIGLFFSCMSMAAMAIAESVRRELAIEEGFSDDPQAVVSMSAMWLLPYYIFAGLGEAFNAIGQNEFYYSQLPKSMSSIATTLFGLGMSVASLVASSILNTVDNVTKKGGESWVSSNINKAHYDYYYWLLTGLSSANLMYFLFCSKAYGPCEEERSRVLDDEDR